VNEPDAAVMSKLQEIFKSFYEIKLAILFGSFASGKQNKESDIDIGVAAKHPITSDNKMEIIKTISLEFGRSVDVVDLQLKHEPILSQIITKGKVIYCDDRKLYAEFIKTVVYDAADFLPLRSRILEERRKAWIESVDK